MLLTEEFLSQYPDMPEHMNELATFVFYRTYSRWLPLHNRRETWREAVARAVEYNVGISNKVLYKNDFDVPHDKLQAEAETLFDNVFNLRQFLSGRTHWIGGAETRVAEKFPLANFNCAYVDVKNWNDLCDLFYLLLVGTGVGFSCSIENAYCLDAVRLDYELTHSEYKPVAPSERLEHTKTVTMDNGYVKIYVGDSKEGWVEALRNFFTIITDPDCDNIKHIKISYNSIRPSGERLVTFGGTASGYEPLKEMFDGIDKVLKNQLDPTLTPLVYDDELNAYYVRPIHIMDIGNLIGANVVVGGVRRTAEMFLCDEGDWEVILAKYGLNALDCDRHDEIGQALDKLGVKPQWWNDKDLLDVRSTLHHRRMSNNSIRFTSKPSAAFLDLIMLLIKGEGEPGFVNIEAAAKRRPNVKGLNPCGEVLLDSYGLCNLTTVNVAGFVRYVPEIVDGDKMCPAGYQLDFQGLMQAQALSARAGLRMTCLDLELPQWNRVQQRDRLVGCSLTGWKDAMSMLGYSDEQEKNLLTFLREVAEQEAMRYAYTLRIPTPLLVTTVKPEGTLSQIAGGVSSGLHTSFSPYYIRRIRINANDPLVQVAWECNWHISPEVGTPEGEVPRTYVIDFPVRSGAKRTRAEQTLEEQFETYFSFQENYTAHNSSNTISVKDDEWQHVAEIVLDRWDDFIGVTFMPYDGGTYELAPYEEITEETYQKLKSEMKPFSIDLLTRFEAHQYEDDLSGMDGCASGACPIR